MGEQGNEAVRVAIETGDWTDLSELKVRSADAPPFRLYGYQAAMVEAMSDPDVKVLVYRPPMRITGIDDHVDGSWTLTSVPAEPGEGPVPRERGWVTTLGE